MFGRKKGALEPKKGRTALIGALVFAAAIALLAIALHSKTSIPGQQSRMARANFNNVGPLKVHDDARYHQVRVGQVLSVKENDDHATVLLQLNPDRPIYNNAKAAVVNERSGLGQLYVEVQPGTPSSGIRPPDKPIPESQTDGAHQLLGLLQVLKKPTRAALASSVQQLGGGLANHATDLRDFTSKAPHLLPDLGTTSASLAHNHGKDLTSMLHSLDDLSKSFAGQQRSLTTLAGQLDTTFSALNVDKGQPLSDTLDRAPSTLVDVRGALHDLQRPLNTTSEATEKIRPGAKDLATSTPDLLGVLREGQTPLGKVPRVAKQAVPALGDLTTVLHDARPVAPKVTQAVDYAHTPLGVLAPYSPEVAKWFSYASSALGSGDQAGHWLRVELQASTQSLDGILPIKDPLKQGNTDAYPKPKQSKNERKSPLLGGGSSGNSKDHHQKSGLSLPKIPMLLGGNNK
jgi:phospholipid/cholesterol/gamma-HCH transport system substrate-binding protein